MSRNLLMAADLVAICVLVFALYFPRHRRRDLVVAYLVANIGVVAVADVLTSSSVAAGLGLGLFGILSIIRLRSAPLDQPEVAYYFASLALGLLAGLSIVPGWLTLAMMTVILAALWLGDHPALYSAYRAQTVTFDRAITDEQELKAALEERLDATVHRLHVRKVDFARGTTTVEARYAVRTGARRQLADGPIHDDPMPAVR